LAIRADSGIGLAWEQGGFVDQPGRWRTLNDPAETGRMTYFVTFDPPPDTGFRLVAGHPHGLQRLLLASGRVPAGEPGRMHLHAGEEVIRILSGELVIRVADERRTCRQGDLAIIPPHTLHGFRVVTDTVIEVIAEQHIGTFFPVRQPDGTRRLVEVYTPSPWNNPPPRAGEYTPEEEIRQILRSVDIEV
jgi:quercetin dioxygenase-like cupin family protein